MKVYVFTDPFVIVRVRFVDDEVGKALDVAGGPEEAIEALVNFYPGNYKADCKFLVTSDDNAWVVKIREADKWAAYTVKETI